MKFIKKMEKQQVKWIAESSDDVQCDGVNIIEISKEEYQKLSNEFAQKNDDWI